MLGFPVDHSPPTDCNQCPKPKSGAGPQATPRALERVASPVRGLKGPCAAVPNADGITCPAETAAGSMRGGAVDNEDARAEEAPSAGHKHPEPHSRCRLFRTNMKPYRYKDHLTQGQLCGHRLALEEGP